MLSLAISYKVQQTSLILWSKKKRHVTQNQRNQSKKKKFQKWLFFFTHLVLSEGDISFIWKSPICIVELSLIFTLGISGTRRPTYKNQKIKKIRYTECFTINRTIWRRPYSKLLWEAVLNTWSPMWARLNLG